MRFAEVRLGDEAEIEALSRLATAIVREHFDPLIGKAQNDYMLKKFQSVPAICGQLRSHDVSRVDLVIRWGGMRRI